MIGTVLGNRYEILTEIGSGGMAKVYKARCRYLQRIVAVKILKEEFREDSEFLKRFDTEAQAAASLTHPNIVQIYDVGRDHNKYYIVMEYVDGITLKEYIENRGNLEWREAVNISIQMCSALSKAHSRNIIHRDIKPHNIIMTSDGVPKVADFGIARSVTSDTSTMKIDTVGSVHYSSPEQARGGYTDEKSDIYSIGVTIYEMVTGKLPFDGETPVAVALKHITEEPILPSTIKPCIPQALNQIIIKAMAKSKQERYETVSELINDLENIRAKNNTSCDIILPNVKHNDKYDTKKFEKLGDDQLKSGLSKKTEKAEGGVSSRKYMMPVIYILLIATIIGSMYYFVSMIAKEITKDPNPPKEFKVGTYTGRSIEEVKKELELSGVEPEIVYEYDETAEENIIIDQMPVSGSTMKFGGDINITNLKLVVSKGIEMVEIPSKENYQDHTALMYYLKDELKLEVEEKSEFHDSIGVNLVIKTDPESGAKVKIGSKVTLYWSLGPEKKQVIVPDLKGLSYQAAINRLMEYKLKMGESFPADREGNQGVIVNQIPQYGETVTEDTSVNVYFEQSGNQTGDNTSRPVVTEKTITIELPKEYTFTEAVRLRMVIRNDETGEEITPVNLSGVPINEFPKAIVVPTKSGTTIKVYTDDILAYEKTF